MLADNPARGGTSMTDVDTGHSLGDPHVQRRQELHPVQGDSDPQDIDISTQVNNEFWVQLGFAVKKGGAVSAIGQGQAAVQYNLPTERTRIVAGPVNLDTVTTPVGDAWAELFATEWMSYYELQSVSIPYDVFDASNYEFKFVLQAVKTDPTQEAPVEDDILTATSAPAASQVTASTFNSADNINAQFFRVVFMAKQAAGGSEGTARAWFAVGVKYA